MLFQKQSGEVIDNTGLDTKNKAEQTENKAEKLLKSSSCGKNKPENKPTDVVENTEQREFRAGYRVWFKLL